MLSNHSFPRGAVLAFATIFCLLTASATAQEGFVVQVGLSEGFDLEELRGKSKAHVHLLDRDPSLVAKTRAKIRESGDYGAVSADVWRGKTLPYIDNFVNRLDVRSSEKIPPAEVDRILAPRGIVRVHHEDGWQSRAKPVPSTIDDWTHFLHSAGGNAVAKDTVVGPPRHIQWLGSPRWSRHHDRMASLSALVSSAGRIFYVMDEGSRVSIQLPPKWTLIARDAFNGVVLWKREIGSWHSHLWPLKSGPTQLARRVVASPETVWVTLGYDAPITALDALTGRTIRTFEGSKGTEELIVSNGILFALVNPDGPPLADFRPAHNVGDQRRVANQFLWDGKPRDIVAFDIQDGKELWRVRDTVAPLTITAAGDHFVYHNGTSIFSLTAKAGKVAWRSAETGRRKNITANFGPKVVLYEGKVYYAGGDRTMRVYGLADGKEKWNAPHPQSGYQSPEDLLIAGGLVWSAATTRSKDPGIYTGRDPSTGKVITEFPPDVKTYWFHHRCYIAKATDKFLLPSRTGIEFVDFEKKSWEIHHWVRGGCLYGIMPANGLIYAPPHNCACYPEAKLFGFNALAPVVSRRAIADLADDERLERGPAFGVALSDLDRSGDWPTFRGNSARSGFTKTKLGAKLGASWTKGIVAKNARLSSPTVAADTVFVAEIDAHRVLALDSATGALRWSFTAGGRIDSPPTFWRERLYFGSADGSVYALRASDGKLIWRFLAAPRDQRTMAFEQLESVWPVHGSVLIQKGELYCVAGRSNFLDGGLRFWKLDALTGKILLKKIIDEKDPESGENLQARLQVLNMTAGLPDILSSDGEWVFMRSQRFDRQGNRQELGPHSGDPARQGASQHGEGSHLFAPMGFLDDTWFHRAYWVYGRSFAGGHAGYYQAAKFAPAGRILVHDAERVYGFGRKSQYYRWTTTIEHELFAASKIPPKVDLTINRRGQRTTSSAINVPISPKIDPTKQEISVEAWIKPEKPNGVVIARGGPAQGYSLFLKGRRARFAVRSDSELSEVAANSQVTLGEWVHVVGVLSKDKKLRIYVGGEIAGVTEATGLLTSDPLQALQIAADEGSNVGNYNSPFAFSGIIDEVRIYHGVLTPAEIRERCTNLGRAPAGSAKLVLAMALESKRPKDSSGLGNVLSASGVEVVKGKIGNALRFVQRAVRGGRLSKPNVKRDWATDLPIHVRAMALADDTIYAAGPRDIVDEEKSFAKIVAGDDSVQPGLARQDEILADQHGAVLLAVSAKTGEIVEEYELPSIPVWDGMAIAGDRLFVVTSRGDVVSFAKSKE